MPKSRISYIEGRWWRPVWPGWGAFPLQGEEIWHTAANGTCLHFLAVKSFLIVAFFLAFDGERSGYAWEWHDCSLLFSSCSSFSFLLWPACPRFLAPRLATPLPFLVPLWLDLRVLGPLVLHRHGGGAAGGGGRAWNITKKKKYENIKIKIRWHCHL